jgi:hypothetical protein
LPEVAVTVTVYVPAGVPELTIEDDVVVVPAPPPQPGTSMSMPAIEDRAKTRRRLNAFTLVRSARVPRVPSAIARMPPGPPWFFGNVIDPATLAGCCDDVRVRVEIAKLVDDTVVPLTVTVDGENVQAAAIGSPLAQAKLTLPLNPLMPITSKV